MTGIILSGGEASRMSSNKAFLKVEGRPVIEKILDVFDELFEEIIIVTNNPELFISYNIVLVGDLIEKRGPMAGLYSGLLNSRNEYNFVVACDMPFLNRNLILFMTGFKEGNDIVVPRIKGLVEPLHAMYSKSCLNLIEMYLKNNKKSLRDLLNESKVRYIEEDEITKIDPDMSSFININTHEDLERVRERV